MIFKTDDAATLVVGYHMRALEEAHLQRKTTLKAEVVALLELGWFTQRRVQEGKLAKLSKHKERHQSCKEKERTGAFRRRMVLDDLQRGAIRHEMFGL